MKVKTFIFGGGHFEKIQYGCHQELIAPGTPSKIDHYDLPLPQKKFGAFVRRVNIWPFFVKLAELHIVTARKPLIHQNQPVAQYLHKIQPCML